MERLLHYVWEHKIFPLKELYTTDGLRVEVIDAGLHNMDAGPDFFNAKLKINGMVWVGNVEIHSLSSTWFEHKHQIDKAYDSVVLHVVGKADCVVKRTDGTVIPQLVLPCPEELVKHYNELEYGVSSPRCHTLMSSLSKLTIHSWFGALLLERMQQRTELFEQRRKRKGGNWEDCFFVTLARNFGFGLNGDAFEQWAGRIPYRVVDKIRDDQKRVEALFIGMAGLLDRVPDIEDHYFEWMKREFAYMKHAYSLPEPVDASRWRLMRTRPGNFPHVRLAQLAAIYTHERGLFSRVLEADTLVKMRKILVGEASEYWNDHCLFGRPSDRNVAKRVGKRAQDLILINTVVPALYAYGLYRGDDALCQRATDFLEQLPPEDNYVTRMWSPIAEVVESAADSQALLQLHKNYCEQHKCLYCRFGYEFMKQKRETFG